MQPPRADRRPITTEHHGRTRVDDYEWLREKDSPEVRAYLDAENAYTEERTAHLADLREPDLRGDQGPHAGDRPVGARPAAAATGTTGAPSRAASTAPAAGSRSTDPDDWTPPQPAEDCAPDQPALPGEEVLLDLNELAEGHEFFSPRRLQRQPRRHPARLLDRRRRRRALHRAGQGPRAPASCSTTRSPASLGGVTWDPRRPGPLLHDRRRVLARPTRSGGTGSAPRRPTTSWSSTRPTAGSGSASAAPAPSGSW